MPTRTCAVYAALQGFLIHKKLWAYYKKAWFWWFHKIFDFYLFIMGQTNIHALQGNLIICTFI